MNTAPALPRSRTRRIKIHSPPQPLPSSQDSFNARFSRVAMLETMIEVQRIRTRRRLVAGFLL
ncbi:MAG: hypothetical protein ACKPJJ_34865, partial [Planctomycetaceae bacterium]